MSSVRIGISPKRTLVFFENLLVFFVVLFSINTFKKPTKPPNKRIKRAKKTVKTAKEKISAAMNSGLYFKDIFLYRI